MPKNGTPGDDARIERIVALLEEHYPQAVTGLRFNTPFQLLVAAILSAQTTDEQVNKITPQLFQRAPTPRDMAAMQPAEVAELIKGCGLFRHKSQYLVALSRILVEQYNERLPNTLTGLMALPGVGRKTANVVINNAFGVPALAVDTHVFRVSRRLRLSGGNKAAEVEKDLTRKLPPEKWGEMHHRLIAHGRLICLARNPKCRQCFLSADCQAAEKFKSEGEG